MKDISALLLLLFCMFHKCYGQTTTVNAGLWSDTAVWSNHSVPTATIDVILYHDITVDVNAWCRSLRLNGNHVTVNTGINLTITDSLPASADRTFLSKLYFIDINGDASDTFKTLTYAYDSLKRVTSIIDSTRDLYDAVQQSYTYFYNSVDTLPYKSILIRLKADNAALTVFSYDTTITYHFYDHSGRNLLDSVIEQKNWATVQYIRLKNMLMIRVKSMAIQHLRQSECLIRAL